MSLFQNIASSKHGFNLLNGLIVITLYLCVEDPTLFFLFAGGIVTLSFFIRRAINQLLGE